MDPGERSRVRPLNVRRETRGRRAQKRGFGLGKPPKRGPRYAAACVDPRIVGGGHTTSASRACGGAKCVCASKIIRSSQGALHVDAHHTTSMERCGEYDYGLRQILGWPDRATGQDIPDYDQLRVPAGRALVVAQGRKPVRTRRRGRGRLLGASKLAAHTTDWQANALRPAVAALRDAGRTRPQRAAFGLALANAPKAGGMATSKRRRVSPRRRVRVVACSSRRGARDASSSGAYFWSPKIGWPVAAA